MEDQAQKSVQRKQESEAAFKKWKRSKSKDPKL